MLQPNSWLKMHSCDEAYHFGSAEPFPNMCDLTADAWLATSATEARVASDPLEHA
jgi:hypothetical protein